VASPKPTKPHGYPRRLRLSGRTAIRAVFSTGRHHRLGLLHAKTLPTELSDARFLISVKKSIGTAPERNRIKRLVREAIRRQRHRMRRPYDICLFLPVPPRQAVTLARIDAEIITLFERLDGTR
jgi:ribonuclease P protein component